MDTALATVSMPAVQPTWRRATHLADLVEIFDPGVQVCVWQRDMDSAVSDYLARLERTDTPQAIEVLTAAGRPRLTCLPTGSERDALIDDVSLLREIICELLGCPAVGLRLARLGHTMCPGWHIDRVGIRLICTYQGPGTQWLDDQGIDRCGLGLTRIANGADIHAGAGEVILLKGTSWQGNEQLGAIHRSPEIAADADVRTLVTLDPLWQA